MFTERWVTNIILSDVYCFSGSTLGTWSRGSFSKTSQPTLGSPHSPVTFLPLTGDISRLKVILVAFSLLGPKCRQRGKKKKQKAQKKKRLGSQLQETIPVRMAWQDNLVCAARRTLGAEKGAGQAGLSKATCQEQTPENQTPPPQSSTVPKIPPPTCWGTAF